MGNILQIGLIALASCTVAVADVLIKKTEYKAHGFWDGLKHPLLLAVVALYLIQILVYIYVFENKGELSIVGIIQTALYAIITIGAGLLFFGEQMTLLKGIGIGLALVGVVLMNL